MLVSIVNHEHNDEVITLVNGIRPYANVFAIDSGSKLKDERHRQIFDLILPNVYYSGLLNAAFDEITKHQKNSILYFICSDIRIDDFEAFIACAREAFQNPKIAVYAPSVNDSAHPQMLCRHTNKIRKVTFVEGMCFAVRTSLLRQLCPIDTRVNQLGHGLDIYLGFLALQSAHHSVVDDRIMVTHPQISGYDQVEARRQRDAWFAQKDKAARQFHNLASWTPFKTPLGLLILKALNSYW